MKYCAEYLPRIQRVSLSVEGLIAPHAQNITANGDVARLGNVEISLPVGVPSQTLAVAPEATSFTVRFQAPPQPNNSAALTFVDAPLSSKELPELASRIRCALCNTPTFNNLPIQWKQLPSEHWAELMDLWHCHKPDVSSSKDTNPVYQKGFEASPGVAFVSDAYLLIDDSNLAKCAHIKAPKLWKWDLSSDRVVRPEAYIASILRETIDAHGIYTFSVEDLLVWVFGLGSRFCMLTENETLVSEGLKVFWTRDQKLRSSRAEIEPIDLPPRGVDALNTALEASTAALPQEAARFGQWNVAFLSFT